MNERELLTRFMQAKRASNLSQNTLKGYEYHLRQYYRYMCAHGIATVTERDLIDYFAYLGGQGYSPVTLKDKYVAIASYMRSTGRIGLMDKIKKPRPRGQARCFTLAEVNTILSCFKRADSFTELRDYAIVCTFLGTGIRKSELLQLSDFNGINDFITVKGKGGKVRSVPVSPALKRILMAYCKRKNGLFPLSSRMFLNRYGEPLTNGGLRAIFTRLKRKTGIPGNRFSPHTMRHFYATNFLRNGGSLVSLQKILGHSELATTAIYLNWNDNLLKTENDRFCPLDNIII